MRTPWMYELDIECLGYSESPIPSLCFEQDDKSGQDA
jgi:hypothetical protein